MKRQPDELINKRRTRPNIIAGFLKLYDHMLICEYSIKILRCSNCDNYRGDILKHIHIFKGFTHKSFAKLQCSVTHVIILSIN